MRFAIDLPAFDAFSDPAFLSRLARLAESCGWDALHLWDHVNWPYDAPHETADAWVSLGAIAAVTERIQLGVMVCPLPRRLPQEVARQAVTLHRLSGGRFVLGVGSGGGDAFDAAEFGAFGMTADARTRGEQLDEALEVITALWSGNPVAHRGPHYTADGVTFTPAAPWRQGAAAIPIWVGGSWRAPRPLRRAARYDAYAPTRTDGGTWTPEDITTARTRLADAGAPPPLPLVCGGTSTPADRNLLVALGRAGLTWWSETLMPWQLDAGPALERVAAGPTYGERP